MSESILNVAVVGCGYWGPNLVRNFISLGDQCAVKLLCDRDPERLEHMRRIYSGIRTTTEFDEVIEDKGIDVVAVATPVRHHYPMARRCLEAGKHVFIEKPMARTGAECADLVGLAERKGLTLMVGHTFIYSAPVRYTKELIERDELGPIQYIGSRRLNLGLFQHDINVAWDLSPHDLSIILYLLRSDPVTVNCQGVAHLNGQEDVISMAVRFADNSFATIQNSWIDPNKVREMTIVGTRKMVVYNDTEPNEKIRIYDKRVEAPPHYDTYAEFTFSYHYGDVVTPHILQTEPLKVECQHLLDCIRSGRKPITGGPEGMKVVQILEAATHSLRHQGTAVRILPDGACELVSDRDETRAKGRRRGRFDPSSPSPPRA